MAVSGGYAGLRAASGGGKHPKRIRQACVALYLHICPCRRGGACPEPVPGASEAVLEVDEM